MFLQCNKGYKLTSAEEQAVDFINQNMERIDDMTISEIAERAFTSPSTVSRAVRKCGYQDLRRLRSGLAEPEKTQGNMEVDHILRNSYQECIKTFEQIKVVDIVKIVEYISKARVVHILAGGATRLVAQEFEFLLQAQGYNAYLQWNEGVYDVMDDLLAKDDMLIVFTVQNRTADLLTAVKKAKAKGSKVVLCSGTSGTSLEKYADITIVGCTRKIRADNGFGMYSRLSLQIIAKSIAEYLYSMKKGK